MREVFGVMGKVIANHNGHIFDFIGDAVLAVFGAPKTNPDHADAAVQSAIEVTAALDELNGRWEKGAFRGCVSVWGFTAVRW